jgi:hypothetical protein
VFLNTTTKEVVMTGNTTLGTAVLASVLVLCAAQVAVAQVEWQWGPLAVPPGDPGTWNSNRNMLGDVVFDGTDYHMYLLGGQTFFPWGSSWQVGHWTATDVAGPWRPDDYNPVLQPGDPGEWDSFTIGSTAVRFDGSMFHMWYAAKAGAPGSPGETYVGYATSPDGSVWTKVAGPLPGLEPGDADAWDDGGVSPHTVLFDEDDQLYKMWFSTGDGAVWHIGLAESSDGLTWVKHPDKPVLAPIEAHEGVRAYSPMVVSYGSGLGMWYVAQTAPGERANCFAASPDGIVWRKWFFNPVLFPVSGGSLVESMAVILEGDTAHGWANTGGGIYYATSPLELVFFDGFDSGDTSIWSVVIP